jgi:hypothetical protein
MALPLALMVCHECEPITDTVTSACVDQATHGEAASATAGRCHRRRQDFPKAERLSTKNCFFMHLENELFFSRVDWNRFFGQAHGKVCKYGIPAWQELLNCFSPVARKKLESLLRTNAWKGLRIRNSCVAGIKNCFFTH